MRTQDSKRRLGGARLALGNVSGKPKGRGSHIRSSVTLVAKIPTTYDTTPCQCKNVKPPYVEAFASTHGLAKSITLPGTTHHTILYYTILHYSILYFTLPNHTIPHHTIPYHTTPYHTILYHTIPYHTIPYYTILYYTILYYTILYYTILYYTILYYDILYCSEKSQKRG